MPAARLAQLEQRAGYSIGEVAFLLSITRDEAIDCDDVASTSWTDLAASPGYNPTSSDGPAILVTLRWHDVDRAAKRVQKELDRRVAFLRGRGLTEEQVARVVGRSQPTVNRRFRAGLEEVLAELARVPVG